MYMHLIAILDVQGIYMLYVIYVYQVLIVMFTFQGTKCCSQVDSTQANIWEVSASYLGPETSFIILILNFSMQMPVWYLKLFHNFFLLYPFQFDINLLNRIHDLHKPRLCILNSTRTKSLSVT